MQVENKTSSIAGYEVVQDAQFQDDWRVEHINIESGDVFIAIFSGPLAEDRAREYARFKNGQ